MHKGTLEVGSIIKVKHNGETKDAKVRKIGPPSQGENGYSWCMLVLDVGGECCYAPARDDELASFGYST